MDSFSVRSAPRRQLIAELTQAADDRESHGKHARAADARRAISQLEAGHEVVFFERVYYTPDNGRIDRHAVRRMSRDDVLAELRESAEGWAHMDKPALAQSAARAVAQIEEGADAVHVGHIVYDITE